MITGTNYKSKQISCYLVILRSECLFNYYFLLHIKFMRVPLSISYDLLESMNN